MPKQKFQLGEGVEVTVRGRVTRVEVIETSLARDTYYTVKAEHSPVDMVVMVNEDRVFPLLNARRSNG